MNIGVFQLWVVVRTAKGRPDDHPQDWTGAV